MSERVERAVELFNQGYNCSQAVFAAYADLFGFDFETACRVSAGLGGGIGRSREVCGAVCGATLAAGMKLGATDGKDSQGKKDCYQAVQDIMAEFKKEHNSIICRELLGLDKDLKPDAKPEERTQKYYQKRPCAECVRSGAKAIETVLFKEML